jgi:hypothetical protein
MQSQMGLEEYVCMYGELGRRADDVVSACVKTLYQKPSVMATGHYNEYQDIQEC